MTDIIKLLNSGAVRRWHTNPALVEHRQNNAEHQWNCAMLLMYLFPDSSKELIFATLTHDVGEIDVGDIPGPFKAKNPEIAVALSMAEIRSWMEILGGLIEFLEISKTYDKSLVLVDKLDAYLFMLKKAPSEKTRNGWPEVRSLLVSMADDLDVRDKVMGIMTEVEGLDQCPRE